MPDKEEILLTKPAEMSFSDWKKMKSALKVSEESPAPKGEPPRNKPTVSRPNNNNKNMHDYNDYRSPQSLLYFESLKQNNQRILGGNMGFNNNMQPMPNNNNRPNPNIPPFPFNNQFQPTPMMNCFNFPDMGNNFMMPRGNIPQQPFPANNFPNSYKMQNPFHSNNSEMPPVNFGNQRKIGGHRKRINKKASETEDKTVAISTPSASATTITTAATTSNSFKPSAPMAMSKKKLKKLKRWNVPKPPTMIVATAEDKEVKQRMWREYRQKMKPFKNRDFHNAKRVVQRLGKKNFDELDEKEKDRLAKAKETVDAYKAKLVEKSRRWALVNEASLLFSSKINTPPTSTTTTSSIGNSSSSYYSTVPPPLPPLEPTTTNPSNQSYNDSPSNDMEKSVNNSNQWQLWNNFVSGGVIFGSNK